MKIYDLFERDPNRQISSTISIKEIEEFWIDQEVDEYVITPEIFANIGEICNDIVSEEERTGIWISNNNFGSGKSHFLKFIFYCLNEKYREKAFHQIENYLKYSHPKRDLNEQFIIGCIKNLSGLTIETIIFDFNHVYEFFTSNNSFTKILLNQLNAFRGYNPTNIALALYLEKPLDKKGKFEAFKEKIESTFNEKWEGNQIRLAKIFLDKIIQLAQEFYPELEEDFLRGSLKSNNIYSLELLRIELYELLQSKKEEYRLIFLIDNISNLFITDQRIQIEFIYIAELLTCYFREKIWLICTGYEDFKKETNAIRINEKIRSKYFRRWIYLEDQSTYVATKRIVSKKKEKLPILNQFYFENIEKINNQYNSIAINSNYLKDLDFFLLNYPFVFYQLIMITDVLENLIQDNYIDHHFIIRDGLRTPRTLINILWIITSNLKIEKIGFFVPFDYFFKFFIKQQLTIHGNKILNQFYDSTNNSDLHNRVVNILFMISNLKQNQNGYLPPTIENISILLCDSIISDKKELELNVHKIIKNLAHNVEISNGNEFRLIMN